jgi:peptidoglycan/LPS O-acetylase OafA/YrhL
MISGRATEHTRQRLGELDGLRAISILLVLASHMLALGPKDLEVNDIFGAAGMSLFFALSGFLITQTLMNRPDVVDFLVRRLARILPLCFLYLLLVFLFWDRSFERLLTTALFLVNYQSQFLDDYTAHLWSLCVEIHFYAAIALCVGLAGQRAVWFVWPACLAITLLRILYAEPISILTHHRVDEILAGACVATLYMTFGNRWRNNTIVILVGCLALILWIGGSHPDTGPLRYLRPYGSAGVVAASIWVAPTLIRKFLCSKPMRYIAEISYALYIFHIATIAGWMNEGSATERYLVKRPISFAMTFILAHLSTYYWETPFRRWASAHLKNRKLRSPQSSAAG